MASYISKAVACTMYVSIGDRPINEDSLPIVPVSSLHKLTKFYVTGITREETSAHRSHHGRRAENI